MIRCEGRDVYLKGKCIGQVADGGVGGFCLLLKSGRAVRLDDMVGVGRILSLEAAIAALTDTRNRENIIVASLTGCLPANNWASTSSNIMHRVGHNEVRGQAACR